MYARTIAYSATSDARARHDRVDRPVVHQERREVTASGRVTMSPSAVTIGVETESRSQPRRYDSTESPTVTSRMNTEPSAPPTTEIVTKLHDRDRRRAERGRRELREHREPERRANVVTTATYVFW